MSDPHAQMIEAALKAWYRNPNWRAPFKDVDEEYERGMRRAIAAAYRAEADALGSYANKVGAPVALWLRKRAAELDGQSDGGQTA